MFLKGLLDELSRFWGRIVMSLGLSLGLTLSSRGGPGVVPDTTAPVLSSPVGTETSPTTATVGATTDEGNGYIWWVVTTSATQPSVAQIVAGLDHLGAAAASDGFISVGSAGAKTDTATGLSASTAYYAHLVHRDTGDNDSNRVSSAQFTTEVAPDVTAPVLSSPTGTQTGSATADLSVTSDEANGTLYVSVLPSASAAPAAAAFIAGTTGGVYTSSDVTPTAGVNNFSATGLAASTAYKAHFFHEDSSGNDSNVVSSSEFTTTAVIAPVLTQTSSAGQNPMSWSSFYEDAQIGTDYIAMRYRIDGGAWTNETDVLFDSDFYYDHHIDGDPYPWPLFAAETFLGGAVVDVQEGIVRDAVTTWSTTLTDTMAGSGLPQIAELDYRFENDNATMFQTITGTTAVASDGDVVGYWQNTGVLSRHLTAAANDTTRGTYRVTGGIKEIQFDGSNDILRNLNDPGIYTASGYTAMVCMRSGGAANKTILGAGNTGGNQYVVPVGTNSSTAANGNSTYRDDVDGSAFIAPTVNHYTNAHPGTNVVIIVVDDGSGITWYVDGVAGTRQTYTRAGNSTTLNNLSVGGLLRTSPISWAACHVQGVFVWPAIQLDSTEIADATTYGGALQGRSI